MATAVRPISEYAAVPLSHRSIALLASPFEGGDGPGHSVIELIWASAGAIGYLPEEGNKMSRVLHGLGALTHGRPARHGRPSLPADEPKLRSVAAALASRLEAEGLIDVELLESALARDGLAVGDGDPIDVRPPDGPADRLADQLRSVLGGRDGPEIALNHYDQANRAFDRGDWEAANAQFRSACDAVFDALAHAQGCPASKTGGAARKWLQERELLDEDEANLTRAFMAFAGRAGSHAGLSGAADSQLRRHFATALMVFAMTKLGS
jgi:hypothetical protein